MAEDVHDTRTPAATDGVGHLNRTVGFSALMFVALGALNGSGWLLGAFNAVKVAGPASILSRIIAAEHAQPPCPGVSRALRPSSPDGASDGLSPTGRSTATPAGVWGDR